MAGGLSTNVQVPYVTPNAGDTFVLEQSNREAEPGTAYVRVHPGRTGITFTNTSGQINFPQRGLRKHVEEYGNFSNTSEIVLRYPNPTSVRVELLGRFIDSEGNDAQITLKYSDARRTITSGLKGYGVVKITYEAPYDLMLATFTKRASRQRATTETVRNLIMVSDGGSFYDTYGTADNDDDPNLSGYVPMTIIGTKGKEIHSISPTPTPDPDLSNSWSGLKNTGGQLVRIRLEADPDYPARLSRGAGIAGARLSASMGLRLYPNVAATMTKTGGVLSDSQNFSNIRVKESIAFNGQASASLQYQPENLPVQTTLVSGGFFDIWGRGIRPYTILGPGDDVNTVTWINSYTYGNVIRRQVGNDELVVTDPWGNAIPCYGVIEVEYTVSYRRYMYHFTYDGERQAFNTAFVAARYGEQFASFQCQPPSLRGVY